MNNTPLIRKIQMRFLFTLIIACFPSFAMALSCLPSNAAREFNSAIDNKRVVAFVLGTLSPRQAEVVRKGFEDVSAEYNLFGTKLMGHGPDKAFDEKITVSSGSVVRPRHQKADQGSFSIATFGRRSTPIEAARLPKRYL